MEEEEVFMCHSCTLDIEALDYNPDHRGLCSDCFYREEDMKKDIEELYPDPPEEYFNDDIPCPFYDLACCLICKKYRADYQYCGQCFPVEGHAKVRCFSCYRKSLKLWDDLGLYILNLHDDVIVNDRGYKNLCCAECVTKYLDEDQELLELLKEENISLPLHKNGNPYFKNLSKETSNSSRSGDSSDQEEYAATPTPTLSYKDIPPPFPIPIMVPSKDLDETLHHLIDEDWEIC